MVTSILLGVRICLYAEQWTGLCIFMVKIGLTLCFVSSNIHTSYTDMWVLAGTIVACSRRYLSHNRYLSSLCEITAFGYPLLLKVYAFVHNIAHCADSLSLCSLHFELCPLPNPCPPINTIVQECISFRSIVEIISHRIFRLQS